MSIHSRIERANLSFRPAHKRMRNSGELEDTVHGCKPETQNPPIPSVV